MAGLAPPQPQQLPGSRTVERHPPRRGQSGQLQGGRGPSTVTLQLRGRLLSSDLASRARKRDLSLSSLLPRMWTKHPLCVGRGRLRRRQVMNQPLPRQGCSPALLWQPSASADASWWPCLPRALTRGSAAQGSLAPEARREGIHCPGTAQPRRRTGWQADRKGWGQGGITGGHGGPCARQGEDPRGPRPALWGTGQAKKRPPRRGGRLGEVGRSTLLSDRKSVV